jgi:hypothetical protein
MGGSFRGQAPAVIVGAVYEGVKESAGNLHQSSIGREPIHQSSIRQSPILIRSEGDFWFMYARKKTRPSDRMGIGDWRIED